MSKGLEPTVQAKKTNINDIAIDFASFVTVEIDDNEQTKAYHIHRDIICHHSAFFSSTFNERPREDTERSVVLRNVSTNIFDLFVRWLYSQSVYRRRNSTPTLDWSQLYVFAEYVQAPRLRQAIIDNYVSMLNDEELGCRHTTTTYVYSNTPPSSPLRRLVVDDYCKLVQNLSHIPLMDSNQRYLPAEFFRDLAIRKDQLKSRIVDKRSDSIRGRRYKLNAEDYYDDEIKAMLSASSGRAERES